MQFTTPGLLARFGQLGFLCRHSFTIVGDNRLLLVPILKMSLYAVTLVLVLVTAIVLLALGVKGGGWLLTLAAALWLGKFFYYNRAALVLSRMVYTTATGQPGDSAQARRQLAGSGGRVALLGALDMVGAWVASSKNEAGGLRRLLLAGLAEVWDLARHFLLPAFAIDRLGLRAGTRQMGALRKHVPATLGGVFGIDILGRVVGTVMLPVYLVALALGLGAGLAWPAGLPAAFELGPVGSWWHTIPAAWPIHADTLLNALPLVIAFTLCALAQAVFARVVAAIKVAYFTLFYARIHHAEDLRPALQSGLEDYLRMRPGRSPETATVADPPDMPRAPF